jgi:serine/threonine-protein kinase
VVGQTIDGRYRVLRVLGEGGMGAVYEAEHTGTGSRVAVKVIHAEMSAKTEVVARFHREARVASAIQTPHIVRVLDAGTAPVSYMVMELLHGEDVRSLLQRVGKLPPDLALRLVGQVCIGLGKAHEAGVIHRDVKPANLFLSRVDSDEITIKVVDFGIAKMVDAQLPSGSSLTATGGMIGSPLYMSPEQAMGRKSIDLRTDVWSLGVVLYEALAGRTPHLQGETFMAVMMAILSKPPPPIQDVAPWVPPEIARIVHRMIAEAPDARFPSMAAVLEAILPNLPAGLSIRATDLVALGAAEQTHQAPRLVLGDEATNAGFEPTQLSDAAPALPAMEAPASVIPATGDAAPLTAVTWAEGGPPLSQGASRSPRRRAFTFVPMVVVPLVLGLASVIVYQIRARPAPPALGPGPTASAVTPSASSPTVEPALPLPELAVRLAIEPTDATVEVEGRVTPVTDGGVELRGALGSAHHVRLMKGSQKVEGEVAITSLGAVPSSMAMGVEVPAPRRSPVAPVSSSKPSTGPAPTGARDTGKHPALNGKFE